MARGASRTPPSGCGSIAARPPATCRSTFTSSTGPICRGCRVRCRASSPSSSRSCSGSPSSAAKRSTRRGGRSGAARAGQVGAGTAWAWRICSALQRTLDWLFVNGVAMLMQQLGLLGLVLLVLGGLQRFVPTPYLPWVHLGVVAAIGIVSLGVAVYRWHGSRGVAVRRCSSYPPLFAWVLWERPPGSPLAPSLLVAAMTLAINEAGLRLADERFPLVRPVGRLMWWALFVARARQRRAAALATAPRRAISSRGCAHRCSASR